MLSGKHTMPSDQIDRETPRSKGLGVFFSPRYFDTSYLWACASGVCRARLRGDVAKSAWTRAYLTYHVCVTWVFSLFSVVLFLTLLDVMLTYFFALVKLYFVSATFVLTDRHKKRPLLGLCLFNITGCNVNIFFSSCQALFCSIFVLFSVLFVLLFRPCRTP